MADESKVGWEKQKFVGHFGLERFGLIHPAFASKGTKY